MTSVEPGGSNPLPRELAPGVFWLGECLVVPFRDRRVHAYHSAFLVVGGRCSAVVDLGITSSSETILAQLEALLAGGVPPLRYLFVTHSEMAHSGLTGLALDRFPQATLHGDVSDLHLVFPRFEGRMHFAAVGDRFDLGGTEIVVVDGVFRDLLHSRWFFDTRRRVLFPGDGFAYSHYHEDDACGLFAEETANVDLASNMALFALTAFHWTGFVEIEPHVRRLDALIERLGPRLIAPSHGLPIGDPAATMPAVRAGLRGMRVSA